MKSGFSTYEAIGETWASAGALVQNNSDSDLFYVEVTYNFIGADGTPVATESAFLDVIPAGESVPAHGLTTTDLTTAMSVTVEITAFAEEDSFFESEWIELELGPDVTLAEGEYSVTLTGTVTNPSDAPIDFFELSCLLVTDDGTVVGGAFTFPDTVAPGQTTAWEIGSSELEGALADGATGAECKAFATLN